MDRMYTPQRPMVGASAQRSVLDTIETLKSEFETLVHDTNMYKMQRDEYERKLTTQLNELNNIQQTLYDLDRNHTKIKQQYEEEIMRLRRQLEMSTGTTSFPNSVGAPVSHLQMPGVVSPAASSSVNQTPRAGSVPPTGSSSTDKGMMGGNGPGPMFYPSGLAPIDPKQRNFPPTVSNSTPPTPTNLPSKRPRDNDPYYNGQSQQPFMPGMGPNSMPDPKPPKSDSPESNSDDKESRRSNKNEDPGKKASIAATATSSASNLQVPEHEGSDWIVGYNPGVQTNLNIDLMHNLEHSSVVCCVQFSHDGKYLATGCNKSAQVYDIETGEKVHTFAEDPNKEGDLYIRSVCFSPDNRFLAAGAEDKTVKVWDVEHRRLHHTFVGHELDIYSLDFSKDGNLIVSGSGDKKAKIWDLEKGECLYTLGNEEVGPKDGVTSVAFSPDGRLVAAGSLDRIVRLWDAQTGYFLERYEGHLDSVYSVAFSPDGRTLASGSLDKTLKLWDLSGSRSRSRCRSTFTGHKDYVLSVAFSPDGNWLISGSKDRSVQFWDPRSAITHMMLQGHKNSVISVAVSPTGRHFATGSGDFRARAWRFFSNTPSN